nr:protein LITTLE ZIPPER 1-like [Ipomoea batatas]
MCISSSEWIQSHNLYISMHKQRSKRSKVQVQGLITRRRKRREEKSDGEKDITVMILQNLKLYMENMSILQENERLRKKASLLHTENLTLMTLSMLFTGDVYAPRSTYSVLLSYAGGRVITRVFYPLEGSPVIATYKE